MPFGWLILTAALAPMSASAARFGGSQGASLEAAAAASGRPPECMAGSRRALARGPSIWEMARVPNLQRYCDLMARAHAQLATQPDAARRAAVEADTALPGRAAPAVVIARASLALGALDEAASAFERARRTDPRSIEDPKAMHDLCRVLTRTGKLDEAIAVYRALVPRIDLLGTTDRRVSVLLEAASVSMAVAGEAAMREKKPARAHLDEALAYLREARQRPPTQLAGEVALSLALALDRNGETTSADAALAEAQRTAVKLQKGPPEVLAVAADGLALEALEVELTDRSAAQKLWERYLAGPGGKGPWATAARARLEALRKGGGARVGKSAASGARAKSKAPR